uniref:Solute carrier family 35 member B1 n=1 Tax=Heterorhabditis bacteriophora TaxID=37862 RepID=A0A1I7X831_HETBA
MYTLPAFFMKSMLVSLMKKTVMGSTFMHLSGESYSVVPKYDLVPALICIYLWVVSSMVSTNIEVISTPVSTVMYNWKDSTSVLYNGILETLACLVSVIINFFIGYTKLGKIEKRKQIIFGLFVFLLFHICNYPWPFYPGPLDYIPPGKDSSQIGGCNPSYKWCSYSVRVPLPLYIFCYVIFYGIAFPFVGSPSGTLFSEILGPRKQVIFHILQILKIKIQLSKKKITHEIRIHAGMMQGMYSFGGSVAQFIAPVLATVPLKISLRTQWIQVRDSDSTYYSLNCYSTYACILSPARSFKNEAISRTVCQIQKWNILHNVIGTDIRK